MTAFDLATRFTGIEEAKGAATNPMVLAMLRLDATWPEGDEVPWCSAFANFITWILRLPRSKKLSARSWLAVGKPIAIEDATPGNDVVILKRGDGVQPGPEVIDAAGHVGFYAGRTGQFVHVLGGNQGDQVCVMAFPVARVLGVRRLA